MNYARVRLLTGGTYTTGISLDWRTQFSAAPFTSATPTSAGEIHTGTTSYGICADYLILAQSPYSATIYVEAAAGAGTVQVTCNGTIQEISTAGSVTVILDQGPNIVSFTCQTGPITVLGAVYDGRTAVWQSLYPDGNDPFMSAAATASGGSIFAPIGPL